MTTDFSVAPEIAQLAGPLIPASVLAAAVAVPRTDGRIAGDLADLAAAPERWWDLVRFDSRGPVRVPLPDAPGTWLLILPPGATTDCDCRQATALAGEAVEGPGQHVPGARAATARTPLRPGRIRVHGASAPGGDARPAPGGVLSPSGPPAPGSRAAAPAPHRIRAAGPGYSVSLHAGSEQNSF